jgi:NAD(P)-dependent dehydrogenase (short-subunit alcohol dehydrogenase family)
MRRQGGGRIVNFSDWLAKSGRPRYPGYLPYYVAKAGVMALTEALALEVASGQYPRQRRSAGSDSGSPGHLRR